VLPISENPVKNEEDQDDGIPFNQSIKPIGNHNIFSVPSKRQAVKLRQESMLLMQTTMITQQKSRARMSKSRKAPL